MCVLPLLLHEQTSIPIQTYGSSQRHHLTIILEQRGNPCVVQKVIFTPSLRSWDDWALTTFTFCIMTTNTATQRITRPLYHSTWPITQNTVTFCRNPYDLKSVLTYYTVQAQSTVQIWPLYLVHGWPTYRHSSLHFSYCRLSTDEDEAKHKVLVRLYNHFSQAAAQKSLCCLNKTGKSEALFLLLGFSLCQKETWL